MLSHIFNGLLMLPPYRVLPLLNAFLFLLPNLDKICKIISKIERKKDSDQGITIAVFTFMDNVMFSQFKLTLL